MPKLTMSQDGQVRFNLNVKHRISLSDVTWMIQVMDYNDEKISKKSIIENFKIFLKQDGELFYEKQLYNDTGKKLISLQEAIELARKYFKFP